MKEQFISEIKSNKGLIYKICRMYCDTKEDQDDLFQDIIIQLWRSSPSYKGLSKFSTWLYQIALNTAVTRLKKRKRQGEIVELDNEALNIPAIDATEKNERKQLLDMAIQKLSDVEKAIIILYMEEYSYKEMSEMIGISESNIGFKLNNIKSKLKEIIKTL